jgi:hypothetical protein
MLKSEKRLHLNNKSKIKLILILKSFKNFVVLIRVLAKNNNLV